jgi:hypothetical protein
VPGPRPPRHLSLPTYRPKEAYLLAGLTFPNPESNTFVPPALHPRGIFVFPHLFQVPAQTNNQPNTTMTSTKYECPCCAACSTVLCDDGSFECLSCRTVSFDPYLPETVAFEARLSRDYQPPVIAANLRARSRSARTMKPPAAVPLEKLSITVSNFVTICGVSPVVDVVKERYANGGIGLQLWDHEGPLLTATQWIPGIPAGCVAIKDYAENEGCLAELVRTGVVAPPHQYLSGRPICRVLF